MAGKTHWSGRFYTAICLLVMVSLLSACSGPTAEALAAVDFSPHSTLWPVSTPEEQGLDPDLVAEMYYNASQMENIYSLLVFKNGYLVAEDYYHIGRSDFQTNIHSVTKSINAALVGIAIDDGCISGVDAKMMDFFPEFKARIDDPRKNDITIQHLLQMRAGYPWEESTEELMHLLTTGFHNDTLVQVPLVRDPGSDSEYSNLSSHILGLIVARACGTDLKSYAMEKLFGPLEIHPGFWQTDWDGNYLGFSDIDLSSTDLAKFGLMMADDGMYNGQQIVLADWVAESWQSYSEKMWKYRVGRNWKANEYGYQWWSIKAGNYRYHLAWGHGGQQIVYVEELDLLVIVLVDPLHLQWGDEPWRKEKASLNLTANFIASLPKQ